MRDGKVTSQLATAGFIVAKPPDPLARYDSFFCQSLMNLTKHHHISFLLENSFLYILIQIGPPLKSKIAAHYYSLPVANAPGCALRLY
jgi:hypothetical protein